MGSTANLDCYYEGILVPDCEYDFSDSSLLWSSKSAIYSSLSMDFSGTYSIRWEGILKIEDGEYENIHGIYSVRHERQSLIELIEIQLPQDTLTLNLAEKRGETYKIPLVINAKTNQPAIGGRLSIDSQGIDCFVFNASNNTKNDCLGFDLPTISDDKPAYLHILLHNIDPSTVSSNTPLRPLITVKVNIPYAVPTKATASLFLKESPWLAMMLVVSGVLITFVLRVLVVTVKPNLVFYKMALNAASWLEHEVKNLFIGSHVNPEQNTLLIFVRNQFHSLVNGTLLKPDSKADQFALVKGLAENTVYWLRLHKRLSEENGDTSSLINARDNFINQMLSKESVEQFKTNTQSAFYHLTKQSNMDIKEMILDTENNFKVSRLRVAVNLAIVNSLYYLAFFIIAGISGYILLWSTAETWGGIDSYVMAVLWGMGISLSGSGVVSFANIEEQILRSGSTAFSKVI